MRFYAMSYREAMEMPIRAFWLVSRNIERIESHEQIGHLRVATAAQSSEAYEELQKQLHDVLADAVVPDVVVDDLDVDGMNFLRNLASS